MFPWLQTGFGLAANLLQKENKRKPRRRVILKNKSDCYTGFQAANQLPVYLPAVVHQKGKSNETRMEFSAVDFCPAGLDRGLFFHEIPLGVHAFAPGIGRTFAGFARGEKCHQPGKGKSYQSVFHRISFCK
ncbi:MAG: hypothetical protein AB7U05_00590 [Mangrovibacterium sp.]